MLRPNPYWQIMWAENYDCAPITSIARSVAANLSADNFSLADNLGQNLFRLRARPRMVASGYI